MKQVREAAVFDLDGTLLRENSSFSFCRFLCRKGVISYTDFFYCASLYSCYLLFHLSLAKLHVLIFNRLFQGQSIAFLEKYVAPFIETLTWYEPALARLEELRMEKLEIYLFSSSPIFLTQPIGEKIGILKVQATSYTIDTEGSLSGIALLIDGEKKRSLLKNLAKDTIAFSDSHHDLPFLESAQEAVAVNPNRHLAKIARARDWEIL
ncbi:MAG: HAD-IB family phosphatase [Chlamydiales bacterium]